MTRFQSNNNPVIIAGDFNLVLNQDMDTCNYVNLNNPKARDKLIEITVEHDLIDVWRELNAEKKEYTWLRKNPLKKARLDFFLISENLFTDVDETCILPGYRMDHSLIFLQFQLGKFQKGKSYWKMNNSLLKDHQYVSEKKNYSKC